MAVALVCQTITIGGGDYRVVLLVALGGMVVADVCCAVMIWRGDVVRLVPVVIALPSLYIVWEFLRRAPGTFGFG
jgi:hypothetical protein